MIARAELKLKNLSDLPNELILEILSHILDGSDGTVPNCELKALNCQKFKPLVDETSKAHAYLRVTPASILTYIHPTNKSTRGPKDITMYTDTDPRTSLPHLYQRINYWDFDGSMMPPHVFEKLAEWKKSGKGTAIQIDYARSRNICRPPREPSELRALTDEVPCLQVFRAANGQYQRFVYREPTKPRLRQPQLEPRRVFVGHMDPVSRSDTGSTFELITFSVADVLTEASDNTQIVWVNVEDSGVALLHPKYLPLPSIFGRKYTENEQTVLALATIALKERWLSRSDEQRILTDLERWTLVEGHITFMSEAEFQGTAAVATLKRHVRRSEVLFDRSTAST